MNFRARHPPRPSPNPSSQTSPTRSRYVAWRLNAPVCNLHTLALRVRLSLTQTSRRYRLVWARRPSTYQSRRRCHLRRTGSRWRTTWECIENSSSPEVSLPFGFCKLFWLGHRSKRTLERALFSPPGVRTSSPSNLCKPRAPLDVWKGPNLRQTLTCAVSPGDDEPSWLQLLETHHEACSGRVGGPGEDGGPSPGGGPRY